MPKAGPTGSIQFEDGGMYEIPYEAAGCKHGMRAFEDVRDAVERKKARGRRRETNKKAIYRILGSRNPGLSL